MHFKGFFSSYLLQVFAFVALFIFICVILHQTFFQLYFGNYFYNKYLLNNTTNTIVLLIISLQIKVSHFHQNSLREELNKIPDSIEILSPLWGDLEEHVFVFVCYLKIWVESKIEKKNVQQLITIKMHVMTMF